jgi:hypothetical protein
MFYVYELCDPNGNVFYVGKGTGGRRFQHLVDAANGSDSRKSRKIRDIWSSGAQVVVNVVFESADENLCLKEEKRRISELAPYLTNISGRKYKRLKVDIAQSMADVLDAIAARHPIYNTRGDVASIIIEGWARGTDLLNESA